MENDFQSASKLFWQTVRQLRTGGRFIAQAVCSGGREPPHPDWGHVRRWNSLTRLPCPPQGRQRWRTRVDQRPSHWWRSLRQWQIAGSGRDPTRDAEVSGCYGAVMADTPMQHCMEVWVSTPGVAVRDWRLSSL
ncbi:hypothetical protein LDENG_00249850, partial [Lucifuga dentata]